MKWLYIVVGLVLIAIAVVLALSTPSIEGVRIDNDTAPMDVYTPAEGTEDFVWESYKWTFIDTGDWSLTGGQIEYGSLYTSDNDGWLIITQRGQVIASGKTSINLPMEV